MFGCRLDGNEFEQLKGHKLEKKDRHVRNGSCRSSKMRTPGCKFWLA